MSTISTSSTATQVEVDIRGPRFVAWVTTSVLVAVLIVAAFSLPAAAALLGLQGLVFAISAAFGPQNGPYGRVYRAVVLPRIGPVTEKEPVAPLRFAQFVGFLFALGGTISFAVDAGTVGTVFTGFALFAAFLNAAFGFCLGCQIYPLVAPLFKTDRHPETA